jgi:hypothetical protein
MNTETLNILCVLKDAFEQASIAAGEPERGGPWKAASRTIDTAVQKEFKLRQQMAELKAEAARITQELMGR